MNNERGFILLLTFIFMIVLTALVGSSLFIVTYETRDMGAQIEDYKLLNLADAGAQRALREIRDEVLSGTPTTGTADLRGNTTSGTAGDATTRLRVRYYNDGLPLIIFNQSGRYVILQDFDLNYLESINSNIAGSVIKSVKIGCRYKRTSSGGGTDVNLEITYTTNGIFPQPGSSIFDTRVSSTSYNDPYTNFIVLDITNDRQWRWDIINNSNFQIRALAHGTTNKDVDVEYLFLQVTYEIDTLKEKWADDSYATFPIILGSGKIQSVTITDEAAQVAHLDEQGKVHLNTATQLLLKNLMMNLTPPIPSVTADTLATNIVNYRTNTKRFDSVEELQQATGMTSVYYQQIRPYVTVYSFITPNVQRPTYIYGRAPVNINTAPYVVLKAIFDPLGLGATDPASLANDIITFRNSTPFTCFYTADTAVTTDFYGFVTSRSYLTATEQNIVLNNADPSLLPPMAGVAVVNGTTTEFCYSSNAFRIVSLADSNPNPAIQGRRFRVQTVLGYDGSRAFSTYVGDPTSVGYRKENFE